MKKLFRLLLVFTLSLVCISDYDYLTFTITSSVNGTTYVVPAGIYSGGSISGVQNATLDFSNTTITGGFSAGSLKNVVIKNLYAQNTGGTLVSWNGHNEFVELKKWRTENVGAVNDLSYNQAYTGTNASMVMYTMRIDSSYFRHSGQLIIGNFGAGANNAGFMDSIQVDNNTFYNITSNGTQLRGIMWRVGFQYNTSIYDSLGGVNPVLGDVGICYVYGSITGYHHNLTNGGRGYDVRLWASKLNGRTDLSQFFQNVRINTHTYGEFNPTSANSDGQIDGTYSALGGNILIHHNTEGNVTDNINYWPPIVLMGNMGPVPLYVHNNLGCAILEDPNASADRRNKNKILVDQSGGTAHPDTANNRYYVSCNNVINLTNGQKIINLPDIGADVSTTPPANQSPIPQINGAAVVNPGTTSVTWNSTGSYDPDGSITAYNWTQLSGPNTASIATPTQASTALSGFTFGSYVFRLDVTDNGGLHGYTSKGLKVNRPPVAFPSAATNPTNGTADTLYGGTSSDPDGTIASYAWTRVSGPSSVTFGTATASQTTVSGLVVGSYVFNLAVTDNDGASSNTNYTLTVTSGPVAPTDRNKLIFKRGRVHIYTNQ